MKFLRRLFGQEQLRRPMHAPETPERRRPVGSLAMTRGDYQLVRV
jgi:hypothetical protein